MMSELEAIRERRVLSGTHRWFEKDIDYLLAKIDAKDKLLAQGREIMETIQAEGFGKHESKRINEWLKAVAEDD